MPDPDSLPRDPIDEAFVRAEARLSDDATRAARRARLLTAIAQTPSAAQASVAPVPRPSAVRYGGWLAAASVAGLSALLALQMYRPSPPGRPAQLTVAPAMQGLARQAVVALAKVPAKMLPPGAIAVAPPAAVQAARPSRPDVAPDAATPQPFAAPAPPPPPPPPSMAQDSAMAPSSEAPARAYSLVRPSVRPPQTAAAKLHTAAASGRIAEIEALLAQGVPVDAPDADGETALMTSIQADRPAAAALLRRHGASLDARNDAGVSARDMAAAKHDPALDEALGLDR